MQGKPPDQIQELVQNLGICMVFFSRFGETLFSIFRNEKQNTVLIPELWSTLVFKLSVNFALHVEF